MSVAGKLSTPAGVTDMDAAHRDGWSAVVSAWLDGARSRASGQAGATGTRFYNPLRTPPAGDPAERKINWEAFPRVLVVSAGGDQEAALAASDAPNDLGDYFGVSFYQKTAGGRQEIVLPFRPHDEYCEWFAVPGADGAPHHYVFTAEGPEYWEFIASGTAAVTRAGSVPASQRVDGDPDLLLTLYRSLVGPDVAVEDLYFDADVFYRDRNGAEQQYAAQGQYNPYNVWNTTRGIVHLTHPSNTLQAEVSLAGDASVLRAGPDGTPLSDAGRLVCCAGYGEPNRSSDPTIGADVNDLVRQGLSVSLRDPVGLYIGGFDASAVTGPAGEDLSSWWTVVRGSGDLILRAEFGPPAGAGFGVQDVLVAGVPLRRAGQLAQSITMTLYGAAADFGGGAPSPVACTSHCCAPDDNPDLLQILALNRPCPPGSSDPFAAAVDDDASPAPLTDISARRPVLGPRI